MSTSSPILVTGAAGQVGGVGGMVARILLGRKRPVRAFVRRDDERAEVLRQAGAEIFVGDLTRPEDVARALEPCRRIYFGMSVSSAYLEAAIAMAAVAREQGDIEVLVHMSQMTVSQMSLRNMTRLTTAAPALACRASLELVRAAGRARAAYHLSRELFLSGLGCSANLPRRRHPASFWLGAHVSGFRQGCGGSGCGHSR